ncbi:MAG TPA: lysylphosphatidylglycerol synthase domain-containing protein [Solirubrobacteraceae bacterium]|nr:lysylphosphatidylglycerol synthase domain-containing protein [Solirubrobacteraceae bacterium]
MRIALLSPYSWTYPGGVTRHIDSLAAELRAADHDVRVLAPYDPDDELSRRLHRGARPQRVEVGDEFFSLGRTVGIPANGAVSNLSVFAQGLFRMREELRHGGYDVLHVHEPVVPVLSWDALCSLGTLPLVGTFHTYSENLLTNGGAAVVLGGRRRMNRLHARIAVSEAAAWTARRFYGGRYAVIPNGVQIPATPAPARARARARDAGEPLRIVFVGQAVERKGLPVLLAAFEALREQIPATLTIVGAGEAEVAHMMLDGRGVRALGKVDEQRKLQELQDADVLCAPSLGGESFGMVLTEGFAAGTPVLASDIPGYRDVVRDGLDGVLVPSGDPLALAQALRGLALDEPRRAQMAARARERAERYAWPTVAAEVAECYERARSIAAPAGTVATFAVRYGLAPADRQPRIPAERLRSLQDRPAKPTPGAHSGLHRTLRKVGLAACTLAAGALGGLALERVGVTRVAGSLLASKPGLVAAALGVMCLAMFARAIAWHAILAVAPTWRTASHRDAMQGTFIGVLMSATLPARMGEHSRALIVARRMGRARETLPVVLGTMVSQALLNLLALALLAGAMLASADFGELERNGRLILFAALGPSGAVLFAAILPWLAPRAGGYRGRMALLRAAVRRWMGRLGDGVSVISRPRAAAGATLLQLAAWALQLLACWLLLSAFGLQGGASVGAAAAVLFAVNVTAALPATPANVGVFQAACVAVLAGAYHVSTPEAIAFAIVLQLIELLTALIMGLPALVNEGLSWREVRLRTSHATPVQLAPLPAPGRRLGDPA